MNGLGFFRLIDEAFAPFLTHLGLSMNSPRISGRFYAATFSNETHSVDISFEPGDKRFLVLVFSKKNGKSSDIDDRVKTLRLADLNNRYMQELTREERSANETFFKSV
jgi:hypothetical protein